MLEALKMIPKNIPITMKINSSKVIKDLSINLENLENTGWLLYQNAMPIKALVAELQSRSTLTTFQKWDNILGPTAKKEVTALADLGLLKDHCDRVSVAIEISFNLTGMKLEKGSQRLFYQGIQSIKSPKLRRSTQMKLAITIYAIQVVLLQLRLIAGFSRDPSYE
ncbi:hypothetical protein F4604DRAFT_1686683 [Suillus subluteus]|nr:hypothetical protein F4604DRAFT_1686683 [Suillus subluteus]